MKFVPNGVSTLVARQVLKSKKNSPAILFGAGVVGMVASTVLACKATLKVNDILDKTEEDLKTVNEVLEGKVAIKPNANYSEHDAKKDKLYIYIRTTSELTRLYAPAILCAVASIAALASAQNILSKRNAALGAAYAALDKGFKEYRQRVVDEYGEEKDREFRYGSEEVHILDEQGKSKTVKRAASGDASIYARFWCKETANDWQSTPEYNFVWLRAQQNYANDLLTSRGHVLLNDVYDMLGLSRTKEGAVVGWVKGSEGDGYIDFGVFDREANDKVVDFMTGREDGIWLDFNVDGVVFDKL